jgi:hypothetical protein
MGCDEADEPVEGDRDVYSRESGDGRWGRINVESGVERGAF